jgi:hypothetical protein
MPRTTTSIASTALLALSLAGLAACGSSSNGGSAGTSVSQFKTQANTICQAGNAEIKKIGAGITSTSSSTTIVAALHQSAMWANKEVTDIRKLKAPPSIAADVEAYLAAVNIATGKILAGGIEVLSGADPFVDADAKAKALGLDKCESGSGT